MRNCGNCGKYRTCLYRGIINPCDDWKPSAANQRLRAKAKEIVGKPMSSKEAQFVDSATTLIFFTAKQEYWLKSIYARVA